MDRTIIGPWKAEERELSQKFYKKLQGLFLINPPTEDLRQCSSDEMFLKPNQHAFFHVMHYFFRLIDPIEFRKRFYWPLTDKRAEANFRSSTVEYLNYLNEKHQLQWANVKSYLLIKPGGMKFINFMLDLVSFIIKELTRQREKQLGCDAGNSQEYNDLNLQRMNRQNRFLKEYASAYIAEVDIHIAKLRQETLNIKKELHNTSASTKLTFNQIMGPKFLSEFERSNQDQFKGSFTQNASRIFKLKDPLVALKEANEKFQSKETDSKYDKSTLISSLNKIRAMYPPQMTALIPDKQWSNQVSGQDMKFDTLLAAFICIYPRLIDSLSLTNQKPCLDNFVTTQLNWLEREFKQIETRITDFHKKLNDNIKKRITENKNVKTLLPQTAEFADFIFDRNCENSSLMLKFISTPPIKIDITENIRMSNVRLPLLEDFNALAMDNSFNIISNIGSRSARKNIQRTADNSFDRSKSKIIDPIKLLNTIKKDTSKSKNISIQNMSTLASKWKERQHILKSEEINVHTDVTPKKRADVISDLEQIELSTTLAQSPVTPFAINELTCMVRTTNLISTSGSGDVTNTSGSLLYTMKLGAVKKLQDATLNIQNSSTSPLGRLSSLLPGVETNQLLPQIKLNDVALDASARGKNTDTKEMDCVESAFCNRSGSAPNDANISGDRFLSLPEVQLFQPGVQLTENIINASTADFIGRMEFTEDALCDISDSVLKDVIM